MIVNYTFIFYEVGDIDVKVTCLTFKVECNIDKRWSGGSEEGVLGFDIAHCCETFNDSISSRLLQVSQHGQVVNIQRVLFRR